MTDRDKSILRAVQAYGKDVSKGHVWRELECSPAFLFERLYKLTDDGYIKEWTQFGSCDIHRRLTPLGEAAIADEGQGREGAE